MEFLETLALDAILATAVWWISGPLQEKKRGKIIKCATLNAYYDFKKAFIQQFLLQAKLNEYNYEELLDVKKFKKVFAADKSAEKAWYSVANSIESNFPEFMYHWESEAILLKEELTLLLNKTNSHNQTAYTILHTLRRQLHQLQNVRAEYDGVKSLMRFFFDLFAGYSIVNGYKDHDEVEHSIEIM